MVRSSLPRSVLGEIAQFTVRPEGVVFTAVVLDDHAGFGERPELLTVETFVTESAMEALHLAVLPRATRIDVDRLDLVLHEPCLDCLCEELTPVVASQEGWGSMYSAFTGSPVEWPRRMIFLLVGGTRSSKGSSPWVDTSNSIEAPLKSGRPSCPIQVLHRPP
jgi:hypothetical protein